MKRIYFDNAASTPVFPEVIEVVNKALSDYVGNPSSIHSYGRKAKAAMEEARKVIAYHVGCSVGEIYFTSGGTEANNTALKSCIMDLQVEHVITSRLEHPSVLQTLRHLQQWRSFHLEFVDTDQMGRPDLEQLESRLRSIASKPVLVSIMHGNNEIGTMSDLALLGNLVSQFGGIFHSDTVQTIGHFPMNLTRAKVDMASASAHKFHGPKGVGFLYLNQRNNGIKALLNGGNQERNIRAGTENVPMILGMARALEICSDRLEIMKRDISSLKQYAIQEISRNFPEVRINGDPEGNSLYTVLSITFPANSRTDLLTFNLDIEGICASGGSACSSGAQKASHVMAALDPNDKGITVRLSFGPANSKSEIDYLVEKLNQLLKN